MAIDEEKVRGLRDELSLVEEAITSIGEGIDRSINSQLGNMSDSVKNVANSFSKDLGSAITTASKSASNQEKIIAKINKGQDASKDIAKEISKIENERITIQRKAEQLRRNGVNLDEEALLNLNAELEASQAILQTLESENQEIQESVGLTGNLAESLGGVLEKLGMGKQTAGLLTGAIADAKAAGTGLGGAIKNFASNLMGAIKPVDLLVVGLKFLIDAAGKIDKLTGETAKNLGISYKEANAMVSDMNDIANSSGDIYVNTENLVKAQSELSKVLGTNATLGSELLTDFTKLTEQAGYPVESMTALSKITQSTGDDLSDNTARILGTAKAFNVTNKLALNEKEIVSEVAKTSAATVLTFGRSADALAKNVMQAKKFGLNLQQAESISSSLLSFQSSIEDEMSAELLTGKSLNFENARMLALQGKTGEAAAEVAKQLGSAEDFGKMNVIQQEALAKAAGMTRDELASSLIEREALAKVGMADLSSQEAYNKLKAQGLSDDEIAKKLGNETLADQMKSAAVQERMVAITTKLKDVFVSIATPILAIVDPLMNLVTAVLPAINLLLIPITETFKGIAGIITGDFSKLSDTAKVLGTIAAVMGTILGINKAITVYQEISAAFQARKLIAKELEFGLGASILLQLGLENAALEFQLAREQGMNVLRAAGVALEQTKIGILALQGVEMVKNAARASFSLIKNVAGLAINAAKAVAGIPVIGPILAVAAAAGAFALGKKYMSKGDDVMSPGYGKRILSAPEGTFALNDKDTVVAGTDLDQDMGNNETASSPSPSINLTPLVEQMNAMNATLNAILNKEGTVMLDSTKVGTALSVGSYKLQ